MVALSRVIGKTPRTLKRFVNIYRIIKAGLTPKQFTAFIGTGPKDGEFRVVTMLLAIAHGTPEIAPEMFRQIKKADAAGPMGLKQFLKDLTANPYTDRLRSEEWRTVVTELNEFAGSYDDDISLEILCEWLPVIVRYTFQLGRLSEEVAPS